MFGRLSSHEREQPSVGCLACDTSSWSFDASKTVVRGCKQWSRRQNWLQHSGLLGTWFGRTCEQKVQTPPVTAAAAAARLYHPALCLPRYVAWSYSVSRPKVLRSTFCMGGPNVVGGRDAASSSSLHCTRHASSPVSSSLRGVMSTASSSCFHFCTRSHGDG